MCALMVTSFFLVAKGVAPVVASLFPGARAYAHVSQVLPRARDARAHVRKLCSGRTARAPAVASFKTGLDGRLRDAPSPARLGVRARRRWIARTGRVVAPSAVTVLQRSSGTSIGAHGRCALYAREKARTLITCLKPSYHSVP